MSCRRNSAEPAQRLHNRCAVCGTRLEPPVHKAHTVCVKRLYWIGGQD